MNSPFKKLINDWTDVVYFVNLLYPLTAFSEIELFSYICSGTRS